MGLVVFEAESIATMQRLISTTKQKGLTVIEEKIQENKLQEMEKLIA